MFVELFLLVIAKWMAYTTISISLHHEREVYVLVVGCCRIQVVFDGCVWVLGVGMHGSVFQL